jgi:hypothetical protein
VLLCRIVKHRLARLVLQRDMQMAGLAGPVLRPFGHEGGHPAAPLRQDLGHCLEQGRPVCRLQRAGMDDGCLQHAGACLGVQALDGNAHVFAELQKVSVELGMDTGAQHRVAEKARRDALQVTVALGAHRMRGFLKQEELELGGALDLESGLLGPCHGAPQHAARAGASMGAIKFGQKQQHVAFQRQVAAGLGQDAQAGIGIGRVPAGQCRVVIELVV